MEPPGFEEFAGREHARLTGALSLYCGDARVAEELAHDALVRAHQRWSEVSRMASPEAWLHRVAINLAHSFFRRRAAEWRAYRRLAGRQPPDAQQKFDEHVSDRDAIRRALARLSERQQQAVVLRFFLDYSVEETAQVLGITPGAVKSYTHRGLAHLRAQLAIDQEEVG